MARRRPRQWKQDLKANEAKDLEDANQRIEGNKSSSVIATNGSQEEDPPLVDEPTVADMLKNQHVSDGVITEFNDFRDKVRSGYAADPVLSKVLSNTDQPKAFRVENGLLYKKGTDDSIVLCIPNDRELITVLLNQGHEMREVVRLHGLPSSIVSDRDPRFTSTWWQNLHKLMRAKLLMSTSFHPQTDGQTERANCDVGQIFRAVVRHDQKDRARKISMTEFAINASVSATTGYAPFEPNGGYMPSMITELKSDSVVPKGSRHLLRILLATSLRHTMLSSKLKCSKHSRRTRNGVMNPLLRKATW